MTTTTRKKKKKRKIKYIRKIKWKAYHHLYANKFTSAAHSCRYECANILWLTGVGGSCFCQPSSYSSKLITPNLLSGVSRRSTFCVSTQLSQWQCLIYSSSLAHHRAFLKENCQAVSFVRHSTEPSCLQSLPRHSKQRLIALLIDWKPAHYLRINLPTCKEGSGLSSE